MNNTRSVSEIWSLYPHHVQGTIDRSSAIHELKKHHRCRGGWFKQETLTFEEAFLLYHGLEPDDFQNLGTGVLSQIIEALDKQDDMFRILVDYFIHGKYGVRNVRRIPMAAFIEFLEKKSYPIPEHFPKKLLKDLKAENNELVVDKALNRQNELGHKKQEKQCYEPKEEKQKHNRQYDSQVLRKEAMILEAKIEWFKERKLIDDSRKQRYSSATELAKRNDFLDTVIELNIRLGLPPLKTKNDTHALNEYEKAKQDPKKLKAYFNEFRQSPELLIDQEWFSPHTPRLKKPGPKKKSKSQKKR